MDTGTGAATATLSPGRPAGSTADGPDLGIRRTLRGGDSQSKSRRGKVTCVDIAPNLN